MEGLESGSHSTRHLLLRIYTIYCTPELERQAPRWTAPHLHRWIPLIVPVPMVVVLSSNRSNALERPSTMSGVENVRELGKNSGGQSAGLSGRLSGRYPSQSGHAIKGRTNQQMASPSSVYPMTCLYPIPHTPGWHGS
jgi:hypothetical protein